MQHKTEYCFEVSIDKNLKNTMKTVKDFLEVNDGEFIGWTIDDNGEECPGEAIISISSEGLEALTQQSFVANIGYESGKMIFPRKNVTLHAAPKAIKLGLTD